MDGHTYNVDGSDKWGRITDLEILKTNSTGALVEYEGRILYNGREPATDQDGRITALVRFSGKVISVTDEGSIIIGTLTSPGRRRDAVLRNYGAYEPRVDGLKATAERGIADSQTKKETGANADLDLDRDIESTTFFVEGLTGLYDGDSVSESLAVFDSQAYQYVSTSGAKNTIRRAVLLVPYRRKAFVRNLMRSERASLVTLHVMRVGGTNGLIVYDCGVMKRTK